VNPFSHLLLVTHGKAPFSRSERNLFRLGCSGDRSQHSRFEILRWNLRKVRWYVRCSYKCPRTIEGGPLEPAARDKNVVSIAKPENIAGSIAYIPNTSARDGIVLRLARSLDQNLVGLGNGAINDTNSGTQETRFRYVLLD
jgi:hypothetical protein